VGERTGFPLTEKKERISSPGEEKREKWGQEGVAPRGEGGAAPFISSIKRRESHYRDRAGRRKKRGRPENLSQQEEERDHQEIPEKKEKAYYSNSV